jgi:hypothetical protein
MRLRFGGPVGDGRPVGRPPDTREQRRFGKILTRCHQTSVAAAVRLSAAFDDALRAHQVYESNKGRRQVWGPWTNPPKIDDLIVDHPRHCIERFGNDPVHDFGRCIYRLFEPRMFGPLPRDRVERRLGLHTRRFGGRVRT